MQDWRKMRVLVIGAARQGMALARYLACQGAQVTLNDRRLAQELSAERQSLSDLPAACPPIQWACGGHPLNLLDGIDLVCPSGGVSLEMPLVQEARGRGLPLSNDSQIFLEAAPCRVIGITGSAGKTTTTTLVSRMAQAGSRWHWSDGQWLPAGTPTALLRRTWVGGNIGFPLIAYLDAMQPEDMAVMELSSFQLEIMQRSPQVAAVLNITPNHLDRHGSMAAYREAKAHILDFQKDEEVAILGRDDQGEYGAWSLAGRRQGRLLSFGLGPLADDQEGTYLESDRLMLRRGGQETVLFDRQPILLRGEHNLVNVLAACAIGAAAEFTPTMMLAGVQGFRGVSHRLEFVGRRQGADWYNDSIATAPERSMAAIRSFNEPLVLLAGGRDKKLPWDDFAELACRRLKHLIVFGEAAEKILKAVEAENVTIAMERLPVTRCSGLQEAVQAAAEVVEPGDVVLLSPGGTSFDEFKDFEERGICFAKWVRELSPE